MKIGIVGLGYVGLTLAIVAASRGAGIFGTEIPKIKTVGVMTRFISLL